MITDLIRDYYEERGLTYPDVWEALGFVSTEMAEVYELLFSRKGGWVRNNPQNKPSFSKEMLAEELGDAIMMLIVAGIVEDVDPLQALINKVARKLEKSRDETRNKVLDEIEKDSKTAKFTSSLQELDDEEYNYVQDDLNFDAERERRSR